MKNLGANIVIAGVLALGAVGIYGAVRHIVADDAVTEAMHRMNDRAFDNVDPGARNDMPVIMQQEYRVSCATVDGGVATDVGKPMDGGTTGVDINGTTWYIAPCTSGSTGCTGTNKIRVGTFSPGVTAQKGQEFGSGARDGVGGTIEAYGNIGCVSEGAAQQADVLVGRRP